jgi:hypothetical protein
MIGAPRSRKEELEQVLIALVRAQERAQEKSKIELDKPRYERAIADVKRR